MTLAIANPTPNKITATKIFGIAAATLFNTPMIGVAIEEILMFQGLQLQLE